MRQSHGFSVGLPLAEASKIILNVVKRGIIINPKDNTVEVRDYLIHPLIVYMGISYPTLFDPVAET